MDKCGGKIAVVKINKVLLENGYMNFYFDKMHAVGMNDNASYYCINKGSLFIDNWSFWKPAWWYKYCIFKNGKAVSCPGPNPTVPKFAEWQTYITNNLADQGSDSWSQVLINYNNEYDKLVLHDN